MKPSDPFWGLVRISLDEQNPLGVLFPPFTVLGVSFGGLEYVGGGFGATRLAFGT